MNIEKLVQFRIDKRLEDWKELNRILKRDEYFSEYEKKEKPEVQDVGAFLSRYGVTKIIDSHTHSFRYEHFKTPRPTEWNICPTMPVTSIPNSPASLIGWVCREVYYKTIGVPYEFITFGLPIYHTDIDKQNDYILAASRKYKTVLPFALAHPDFSKQKLKGLVAKGFRGFKPYSLMRDQDIKKQTDLTEIYLNMELSSWLTPNILGAAKETGVPIMLHIEPETEKTQKIARELILDHPKVNFILAHFGLCHTVEAFKDFAECYAGLDHVFLETSNLQNPEVLEYAFQKLGTHQVLYGSDLPFSLIRHGVVQLTQEMVDDAIKLRDQEASKKRMADEELKELDDAKKRLTKTVGMKFPSTKGDFVYLQSPNIRALQSSIPKRIVETHQMAIVSQLRAIQAACQNLVAKKYFTPQEMSGFLQAFFCGNAKRLLHI